MSMELLIWIQKDAANFARYARDTMAQYPATAVSWQEQAAQASAIVRRELGIV